MKLPPLIASNINARTHKHKIFLRILLVTMTCIIAVVVLLSLLMYSSFKNLFMERNEKEAIASFRQIEQTTDRMTQTATALAIQVMLDKDCSSVLMSSSGEGLDALTNDRIMKRMRFYRDNSSYVHSIYLYNHALNRIYSTEPISRYELDDKFPDTEMMEVINHFGDYNFLQPIKRTFTGYNGDNALYSTPVLSYVLNETGKQDALDSAVIINISQDWLYQLIDSMYGMDESAILALADDGGEIVDYKNNCTFDWKDEAVVAMMEKAALEETFSFEIEQNGVNYYATYFKSVNNGWQYVKVSKWDNVFVGLQQIKDTSYLILAIILLIALVISVLIAGNFYKIYTTIEKRYNRLISANRGDAEVVRTAFLLDVLAGTKQIHQRELGATLKKYGIPFDPLEDITVIMLKIENYHEFEKQLGNDYIYDMKYGIKNIFEELAAPYFKCVSVIEPGDSITLLVSKIDENLIKGDLIEKVFREYCKQVGNFIDWQFILLYSEQEISFNELTWFYHELKKHDKDTFFYPSASCLNLDCVIAEHSSPLDYPTVLEKRIIKTIRGGDTAGAMELYEKFVKEILCCQYDNFITGLTLLCFAVTRLFEEYDDSDGTGRYDSYTSLLNIIYSTHKLDEMQKIFFDMFDVLKAVAEDMNCRSNASERLDEVKQYICDHYENSELSLEVLAARFALSSSYMGKTFKKAHGVSVTEYINEVRVQKIAELLVATDELAKDIAVRCGFYNVNYFYTYFKKYYGLTPQAYRNKYSVNLL